MLQPSKSASKEFRLRQGSLGSLFARLDLEIGHSAEGGLAIDRYKLAIRRCWRAGGDVPRCKQMKGSAQDTPIPWRIAASPSRTTIPSCVASPRMGSEGVGVGHDSLQGIFMVQQ